MPLKLITLSVIIIRQQFTGLKKVDRSTESRYNTESRSTEIRSTESKYIESRSTENRE